MKAKFKLLFLFLLVSSFIHAQGQKITGTVTSADDSLPLPGVNIIEKGTTNGTNTDFDGNYSITVNQGAVLEFSSLGFKTVSITVGSQNTINVTMETDVESLGEVVVIGYGTAEKRDLTGSIVKVSGDVVADKPATNPVASLQGRVAGLSVVNSGTLGQEPDIRIRGTSSRYSTKPLYVVDGIFADDISFVNPNDIESIEILKDASSLAIFGVRGANGVIIVTTKKAKAGKLTINFNSTLGFKNIVNAPDMADAALFRELYDERLMNEGLAPFSYYDLFTGNTDWVEEISKESSFIQTNNISIQSASEKNKISFGLGYRNEDGLIKQENLQRLTMNLNDEFNLSDNIKIGLTGNFYKDKLPNTGGFSSALNATPIVDPIHYDSRPEYNGLYNQLPIEIGGAQIGNPLLVAEVTKNKNIAERYRFVGSVFGEVKFLKDFTFRTNLYGDYDHVRGRSYTPIVNIYTAETDEIVSFNGNQVTRVNQNSNLVTNFQQEYLLTYKKDFGPHGISATLGYTTTETNVEGISGSVEHDPSVGIIPDDPRFWYVGVFPYGDPTSRTSGSNQFTRATTSWLGRALYNYDDKYLLNGSYRRDATSQLAPNSREQDFWSIGAGWVVSEESFLENSSTLNLLKLKGSIGELGNQFVPVNYPFYPGVNEGATAVFGENVIPGYIQRFEENPNLKWETVKLWEVGLESEWFNNRLTFNANYYNRLTENLLVFVDIGTAQFFDNSGEIRNKGFEFEANWGDTSGSGDFGYSIGGNITTINNEVVSTRQDAAIFSGAASRTITGEPIGHFYGYIVDGLYQSNADIAASPPSTLGSYGPGDFKYRDVNGDGEITPDDRTVIGNPTPDFTYGFYVNLDYKNFFLNMDFQGVYGNEIYRDWGNGNSFAQFNYRAARANRWTQSGSSNWEPRLYDASEYNRLPSTYMIEDGSYFRIRNVQLGYNFDPFDVKNVTIQQMKVYFNIQNLYTWKDTSGFSPEAGGSPIAFGIDNGGYPIPVISTLGFSITF
ncbi:TonB-dependent receptor [Subsaxibacter sp. CAU 1640]|uniref:SusC/RagA family TonB-linked outer membrane protein n=1 Tax=Subsaxibacter sp. CAU 1640 TaxID=2933271 RepID=UPI002002BEAB|nr:TonB-dependent receptor [Subsaxibacter sp. CAU 1640]MCK7590689.1 TonB-dependent receptor [Subsaxibacter sp. CAU 1640]